MSKAVAKKPIPVSALEYRPRDYFGRYDLQAELLSSVKGRARRALIKEALETGEADTLPDFVTTPELEAFDRQMLGRLHPLFMGGEYLPKIKPKEVEIARISIQSTTYDVTVLYARRVGQRIHYRVVDEYEGETLQEPSTRTSTKPLTMGAMIDFFITTWSLMDCLEFNFEEDVEGMLGFFTAESEFYPCFDQTLSRSRARYCEGLHLCSGTCYSPIINAVTTIILATFSDLSATQMPTDFPAVKRSIRQIVSLVLM